MIDLAAINVDQLVTATDRVLAGNLRKARLARASWNLTVAAQLAAVESDERTVYVRSDRTRSAYVAVLGAAAAAAWLAVGLVCLLA